MMDTENIEKILTQMFSNAERCRALHGEGAVLTVPAIYIACLEAVTAKVAAQKVV